MDEAVRTRRASVADLDVLAPLFDGYRQFYGRSSDIVLAQRFLGERLKTDESVVLLAESGGAAIGFVQLYPSFSSLRAQRIFILNDLFVSPDARRNGAARALLAAAVAFAGEEGAARLTLSTAIDNHVAQAAYEQAGWEQDRSFIVYNFSLAD